jgi:GDPmannose 4,6-dehydratase
MKKRALITGINGMDGSHLADFLLNKDYDIFGIERRKATYYSPNIEHLEGKINLIKGDLSDQNSILRAIKECEPNEIYNLGAQSFVGESWAMPEQTSDITGLGALRVLEAIRENKDKNIKFYQASSSEMFGKMTGIANEETTFYPCSPYGVAKLYAHWITKNYRESYGIFAVSGILFNHECISPNNPLIIKENGFIKILRPIDIRKPKIKGTTKQQWEFNNLEIWDGENFVTLNCMTATKRKNNHDFRCRITNTRNGVFETTNHHNLLDESQNKIKTDKTNVGFNLLHGQYPIINNFSAITPEEAEFLGLMVGDGWISKDGVNSKFTNNNENIRNRIIELWSKISLGYCSIPYVSHAGFGKTTQINLNGNHTYLSKLRTEIYTHDGLKKIPERILNGDENIKLCFLKGYNLSDGLKSNPCVYDFKNFKTNSSVLACGLLYLINTTTKQSFNVTFEEDEKYYGYYSINFHSPNSNENHHLRKNSNEIKKVLYKEEQPEWVFDIETGSRKFMCGVGLCVVSNSERRGHEFVTRKISDSVAKIHLGICDHLILGNLDPKRDWGYAPDYVEGMWMMMQQDKADDYVLSTGESHSVREFLEEAFNLIGINNWQDYVKQDPKLMRPVEVNYLLGDSTKARNKLNWKPKTSFKELVKIMVENDIRLLKQNKK